MEVPDELPSEEELLKNPQYAAIVDDFVKFFLAQKKMKELFNKPTTEGEQAVQQFDQLLRQVLCVPPEKISPDRGYEASAHPGRRTKRRLKPT